MMTLRPNIALMMKIVVLVTLLNLNFWPVLALLCVVGLLHKVTLHLPSSVLWGNVLLGAGMLLVVDSPYRIWICCLLAGTFLFIEWPLTMLVLYDGDCGLCKRSKRVLERLDFDHLLTWQPSQKDTHGLQESALEAKMHVIVNGDQVFAGYAAFRQILLFSTWFWLTVTVLFAAPPEDWFWWRRIVVVAVVSLFLPFFQPVGEIVYSWVARNRHILPGSTCGLKNL